MRPNLDTYINKLKYWKEEYSKAKSPSYQSTCALQIISCCAMIEIIKKSS